MNTQPKVSEKKIGPIVASLVIVLVLVIVALYLFASKVKPSTLPTDSTPSTGSPELDAFQSDLDNSTNGLEEENF